MKKRKLLILIIYIGLLSGCAKVPETGKIGETQYAKSKSEKNIDEVIKENSQQDDEKLDSQIGSKTNGIYIDLEGIVYPQQEKISEIVVEPMNHIFDKEKVIDSLFQEKREIIDNTEELLKDTDGAGPGDLNEMGERYGLWLENENETFLMNSAMEFHYSNQERVRFCESLSSVQEYFDGRNISESFSKEEALQILKDKLALLDIENVNIDSVITIIGDQQEGYYKVIFSPTVDGIPIASSNYVSLQSNIVSMNGSAEISAEGIASLSVLNFRMEKISIGEEMDYLTMEQLWKVLLEYVKEGTISGLEGFAYSQVALSFLPYTEDWQNVTLKPVWRIYTPLDELMIKYSEAELERYGNLPLEICINAFDGKIERME